MSNIAAIISLDYFLLLIKISPTAVTAKFLPLSHPHLFWLACCYYDLMYTLHVDMKYTLLAMITSKPLLLKAGVPLWRLFNVATVYLQDFPAIVF